MTLDQVSDRGQHRIVDELAAHRSFEFGPPRGQARKLFVERRHARARVNDPDERDRICDCELGLAKNVRGYDRRLVRHDSARVNEREAAGGPLGLAVDSVARDARLVADNRAALADEAVEER